MNHHTGYGNLDSENYYYKFAAINGIKTLSSKFHTAQLYPRQTGPQNYRGNIGIYVPEIFSRRRIIIKFIKVILALALFVTLLIAFSCRFPTANNQNVLFIEVVWNRPNISLVVDGATVMEDASKGIYVFVLNQTNGNMMAQRTFKFYSPYEDDAMSQFLNMISDGRIIVFAIKDAESSQMNETAINFLKKLGSEKVEYLYSRDMWAMVIKKGDKPYSESLSKNSGQNFQESAILLKVEVPSTPVEGINECVWPDNEESKRRREFCNKVEGYENVCSCENPSPITFSPTSIRNSIVYDIPVIVIASNRPQYLYRMLKSLLSTTGVNHDMVTVFIDGFFEEPLHITKLFGIRGIQHNIPLGQTAIRLSQHYKASITSTFKKYSSAKYVIILEDDLDVSIDFFSYFNQTLELIDKDSTIYCISAWNDLGYAHTSKDPSILYRVETMPGLGWLLKRSLFEEELEPKWPTIDDNCDWDQWMRTLPIRKNRECIIPEISRTYHFGAHGLHINPNFQNEYFTNHLFNVEPLVKLKDVDSLLKPNYEELILNMIKNGYVIDHSKNPCEEDFIPEVQDKVLLVYIKMIDSKDFTTWLKMAKCFKTWDMDARSYHNSMWRLRMKGNEVLIIGVPNSDYSQYKPSNVTPIHDF